MCVRSALPAVTIYSRRQAQSLRHGNTYTVHPSQLPLRHQAAATAAAQQLCQREGLCDGIRGASPGNLVECCSHARRSHCSRKEAVCGLHTDLHQLQEVGVCGRCCTWASSLLIPQHGNNPQHSTATHNDNTSSHTGRQLTFPLLPSPSLPCAALRCLALPCAALRCLALPCLARLARLSPLSPYPGFQRARPPSPSRRVTSSHNPPLRAAPSKNNRLRTTHHAPRNTHRSPPSRPSHS
ncbi:hypothetical protein P154DRAFT_48070 [Amniculicola lignicola CBS 123094]|uniref:Uncharacterized protein n=1 Tax=Amniculicola lignicola CBS 123094 TaxID=1392246 RepID=A0A6A5VY42_9PLEO|nr:hypothetical protein P154DRAFT_48070 [Amniculicola lignicola CBS 123094]